MIKLYLTKNVQHQVTSYTGSTSARALVRLAKNIEIATEQEAQRPLNGRKVQEVAQHVDSGNDGLLPGSIVIATVDERLKPQAYPDMPGLYYMDFPSTDDEFLAYAGTIEIMDGQHRLFSFKDAFRLLSDSEPFDLSFNMYIQPTLRERQIIFKVANEKQDKVSPNLLMWFRAVLNMLTGAEKEYQPLINLLNTENCSPLQGRIITAAQRITNGIKAQQLIKIFSKAKLSSLTLRKEPLNTPYRLKLICTYLKGWQLATGCKFSEPDREYGPLTKISGLRYIFLLLPTFYWAITKAKGQINETQFADMIKRLYQQLGTTPKEFFDPNSSFNQDNPESLYAFRSEGGTTALADAHIEIIKGLDADDNYDPFS